MTAGSNKHRNRLRIIGGEWRSRIVEFPDAPGLRPTPDRVRETLFNWIQHAVIGANCLDLFAGSGALGLEALSRGAGQVTALELNTSAAVALEHNAARLGTDRLELIREEALRWLGNSPPRQYNLVFIDPPFASALQEKCLHLLDARDWLSPGALIYVEAAEALTGMALPSHWELLKQKRAGEVHFGLCRQLQSSR